MMRTLERDGEKPAEAVGEGGRRGLPGQAGRTRAIAIPSTVTPTATAIRPRSPPRSPTHVHHLLHVPHIRSEQHERETG